jgi:hypothetical protein
MPAQQRHLGIDYRIFTPAVVITIVHDKNFHGLILGEPLRSVTTWLKRVGYHRPHDRYDRSLSNDHQ